MAGKMFEDLEHAIVAHLGKRIILLLRSGHSISGIINTISKSGLVELTFVGYEYKSWGKSDPGELNYDAMVPLENIVGLLTYVRHWKSEPITKQWVDKDGYECSSTEMTGTWVDVEFKDGEYVEVEK